MAKEKERTNGRLVGNIACNNYRNKSQKTNPKGQILKDKFQIPRMEGASASNSFRSAEIVGSGLFCSAFAALFGAGMTSGGC